MKIYKQSGKCQSCKEEEKLYKVQRKGKIVGFCEMCLRGYFLSKAKTDKEIDNYFL